MIRFQPIYKSTPWGGRAIAEQFDRRGVPEGPVGESWELASFGDHDSRVIEGEFKDKTLSELWRSGVLGGSAQQDFPFLLKWLHATEFLSVQVHPDEATCERIETGRPKSEAWLIVDRSADAVILAGHYPGLNEETLKLAAAGGTVRKWLYEMRPRVGEMVPIEPGTIHSIGPGHLILEVQQPSNTTFRIFDWNRVGLDGQPRELHLEQASASIPFQRYGPPRARRDEVVGPCFRMKSLEAGAATDENALRVFVADSVDVDLESARGTHSLRFGDVLVAEKRDGPIQVTQGSCVLVSEPG